MFEDVIESPPLENNNSSNALRQRGAQNSMCVSAVYVVSLIESQKSELQHLNNKRYVNLFSP